MIPKIRKDKQYRITIEDVGVEEARTLEFEYQDLEDLFKIVEGLKKGSGLEPENATKVAVALRLLGPVMMKDRKHPLFINFMPHFKCFMQNLKSTVKKSIESPL
ncbi:TPA: DUF3861 domain-containing protein [Vibrio vulnificus]|uniref:DUF3861 domain-containing protein n=1 Tax=Vibrio vulnificus TaxID=672 RepID=UPI0019D4BBFC|nr:DUF3861 domain-containing protein [Vibrio vulnificus]MBN8143376.1 DUF3861 domain-containing protein [Vibrio vulnificus]HDY7861281.1 DUF3861 domain-containing protein [Vibrio vulnificus]HDY7875145.1 DUF3861 domain-containing protein [Vibrio vulnificus]HDY8096314.1 DUF3861 domain-containing protein [Vibrio vulnificus]HDY8197725.1 DUF3861 domain-containing protein [Vibrio vulnificus]